VERQAATVDTATLDDRLPVAGAERVAVLFTRALRREGLSPAVGSVITFLQSLGEVDAATPAGVYWAGRATLVHRPEDIPVYNRAFSAFWTGLQAERDQPANIHTVTLAFDDEEEGDDRDGEKEETQGPVLKVRWSAEETLRQKDFAQCDVDELDELRRLMSQLRLATARRSSRRWRRAKGRTPQLDLRRTVRNALKADGEAIRRAHVVHGTRARRLVLLLDISGSMEPYSRALLRFIHAAVVGRAKVEAFTIGTRLTRLTRELQSRDPDAALRRASASVADWSGGTRLGETLADFNDTWGQRGMARGAVVVLLSDGWDRGDPAVLGEQMARLHRAAHRVVWVNPLKATEGYAPLAQGMAAALPHVDSFIEGHSLASLERLAEEIAA
jgi:hypothetical protein